jgi:CheY-like chemotaxis protein
MSIVRVLIVGDDDVVCANLISVLRETGFAVTCTTSVAEALERISSETYDVLLSGLRLPPTLNSPGSPIQNEGGRAAAKGRRAL